MDPRNYIGRGEEAKCCVPEIPITPIHEMLAKMNELAIDIREHARYIDSSLLPVNGKCAEAFPTSEGPDNMHEAIKQIMNELVIANETLVRVRNCL